jgi:T-complex protein 1 subunit theta
LNVRNFYTVDTITRPTLLLELSTFSLPSPLTSSALIAALKPAIASKQYGFEDTLSELVAEAALTVMPSNPKNFNVDNVRVVKIMGGSLEGSKVVPGMVFPREPEGMIKKATKAKVAVFTSAVDISQSETKGTVLLKNAEEMLNFTRGEEQHLEKVCLLHIRPLLDAQHFSRSSRK